MFKENKYTKWYDAIIGKAKTEHRVKMPMDSVNRIYYESHHIVPKCMGGTETVLLTAKEHFVCHLLLTKMTDDFRMKEALNALCMVGNERNERIRINSTLFAYVRKCRAEATSERCKGRKHSDEHKRKAGAASGAARLGKKRGPIPKISERLKGKPKSPEHAIKCRENGKLGGRRCSETST